MLPAYNSSVSLFQNTPVEIRAEAAPGYSFVSWSNGSTDPVITVTLNAAMSLTANFASGAETVLPSTITAPTTLGAAGSPRTRRGWERSHPRGWWRSRRASPRW